MRGAAKAELMPPHPSDSAPAKPLAEPKPPTVREERRQRAVEKAERKARRAREAAAKEAQRRADLRNLPPRLGAHVRLHNVHNMTVLHLKEKVAMQLSEGGYGHPFDDYGVTSSMLTFEAPRGQTLTDEQFLCGDGSASATL